MPRSLPAQIARSAYRALRHSPLAPALELSPVQALRHRMVGMRTHDVLAVLDAVAAAGVHCWVVGGWGVDALLGRETRLHDDLDLAFDAGIDLDFDEQPEERARLALSELGYEVVEERAEAGIWMPTRILTRDTTGRGVDLLAAGYEPARAGKPAPPGAITFAFDDETFTEGSIDGRRVPCLSVGMQLAFHGGYPPRLVDRADVGRLCERFDLAPPSGYRVAAVPPGAARERRFSRASHEARPAR